MNTPNFSFLCDSVVISCKIVSILSSSGWLYYIDCDWHREFDKQMKKKFYLSIELNKLVKLVNNWLSMNNFDFSCVNRCCDEVTNKWKEFLLKKVSIVYNFNSIINETCVYYFSRTKILLVLLTIIRRRRKNELCLKWMCWKNKV